MKYKYTIIYTVCCILLGYIVFLFGNYVLKENFDTNAYSLFLEGDTNTPLTSHSVDMPLNTTFSCNNFCGPNAQCSITREQCTSDVDCYGCQPVYTKPPTYINKDVEGENDAGKLTYNQTPQYSTLTTDIGTEASLYGKKLGYVPKMYQGVDAWMKSSNYGMNLFNKKLKYKYSADPKEYTNQLTYPIRESTTGLFEDNGPLAANAYL